jgi:hypothetical protein
VIVMLVPPLIDPDTGATLVTVGAGAWYVNALASVPDCVSALVTVTPTRPAACAAVVAVIVELLTTLTPVAAVPPMLTVAPETKLVPLMVTAVPPAVVPEVGETPETVGAGPRYVKALAFVPL